MYLTLPAHLPPAPPLPVPKSTNTDPVTPADWSLIFHHHIHTEGSEFAPKCLTSLLLLVCSQKTSKSHLTACQAADRKPPVSPRVSAGRVYPADSMKLPIKGNWIWCLEMYGFWMFCTLPCTSRCWLRSRPCWFSLNASYHLLSLP